MRIFKKVNHSKSCLLSRYTACEIKDRRMYKRTKVEDKDCVSPLCCGLTERRSRLTIMKAAIHCCVFPAGLIECRWLNKTSCFEAG